MESRGLALDQEHEQTIESTLIIHRFSSLQRFYLFYKTNIRYASRLWIARARFLFAVNPQPRRNSYQHAVTNHDSISSILLNFRRKHDESHEAHRSSWHHHMHEVDGILSPEHIPSICNSQTRPCVTCTRPRRQTLTEMIASLSSTVAQWSGTLGPKN